MVTYQIELNSESFSSQWVVVAVFGNSMTWEVGRYHEKRKAQERIKRMDEIAKADALTE